MNDRPSSGNGGKRRDLPQAPQEPEVKTGSLLATLGAAGALAGLLIVMVHQVTQPAIQAHKAEVLRSAVQEVLGAPHHYDTLYVYEGALVKELPQGASGAGVEQLFLGFREDGEPVGFAITGAEPGFQDVIELIFGYDPGTRTVLGMKVLSSRETPGLGDKIDKDQAFVSEFEGVVAPIKGVKSSRATGAEDEVDMITGATISSRTVIGIINHRLERLGPILESYTPSREAN